MYGDKGILVPNSTAADSGLAASTAAILEPPGGFGVGDEGGLRSS